MDTLFDVLECSDENALFDSLIGMFGKVLNFYRKIFFCLFPKEKWLGPDF